MEKHVEKIKNEVGFQSPFLCQLPLPAKSVKLDVYKHRSKVKINEIFDYKWKKKIGKKEIVVKGDPDYGLPYGRDILVILYLIEKCKANNWNPIIKLKSVEDYINSFNLGTSKKQYVRIKNAFKRIFNATWHFYDREEKNGRIDEEPEPYKIIKRYRIYFDEKGGDKTLFENTIELDHRFVEQIKQARVPYKKEVVLKLKRKVIALNLYLFLSFRTWYNLEFEKKEIFIPFFGPGGLQEQISSDLAGQTNFRRDFHDWLKDIKEAWPECPVYLKKIPASEKKTGKRNKEYKDGLFINTTLDHQLTVGNHISKKLRKAKEDAEKEREKNKLRLSEKQENFILAHAPEEMIDLLEKGELSKEAASKFISATIASWSK